MSEKISLDSSDNYNYYFITSKWKYFKWRCENIKIQNQYR